MKNKCEEFISLRNAIEEEDKFMKLPEGDMQGGSLSSSNWGSRRAKIEILFAALCLVLRTEGLEHSRHTLNTC